MQDLPPAVVENVKNKETVFFVGAGFSLAAGFPSSLSIATLLVRKLEADGKRVDVSTRGH